MFLFRLKYILICIIADKASILWSKCLGEGKETWFWVSEVPGGGIAAAERLGGDITPCGKTPQDRAVGAQIRVWLSTRQPAPADLLCSETHI